MPTNKPSVFIDGEAGTTGLGIRARLEARPDVILTSIASALRKDVSARRDIMAEVDAVVLCLPDEAAREAAALADQLGADAPKLLDASTAHRVDPDWTYEKDFERGTAASIIKPNKHGAEQGTCVHLGTCDIGCEVNARNTLDLNYLFVAETRHHAEIRPLHLVDRIEPRGDGGYNVRFDRLENNQRIPGVEAGRVVVVAAGSLASTELLLRNRDIHRTLPKLNPCA